MECSAHVQQSTIVASANYMPKAAARRLVVIIFCYAKTCAQSATAGQFHFSAKLTVPNQRLKDNLSNWQRWRTCAQTGISLPDRCPAIAAL